MSKILKLELKKFNLIRKIWGVIIANLVIMFFLITLIITSRIDDELAMENYTIAFQMVSTLVGATFIIFASVLHAKTVIEEYKNKTITLLFMYPISRKKLIFAKLFLVVVFTFLSIVLSDIFQEVILYILNMKYQFIHDQLTRPMIYHNLLNVVMYAFAAAGMALIPLFFGMLKKSVPATIVTSLIIVSIVYSNNGGMSLLNIIIIPIILAIIGIFIAFFTFRNIEHIDVA